MTDATTETPVPLNKKGKPHLRELGKLRTLQRITDAARAAFDQDGYEAATIRSIAKAAGMSTGALFSVYPDGKPALYQAVHGHPVITPEHGRRAMVILRALALDLEGGPHDMVDEIQGLDIVKAQAGDLLDSLGIARIDAADVPDPDETRLVEVYEAALERPL